jgi:hypothetical protein
VLPVKLDTQDTGGRKQNKIHHKEKLATLDTQDTGGRQTKQKYKKERYWQH